MKFAHDSIKSKTKAQNENFCFDIETTQGHFFAVLDFAPHDYANLNATLASKLETVAGSFASLSKFSPDLFLGFLAREINNFLHHLGEQSSGPEIFCSAALCVVGGSRLHYLICGDVRIEITGGRFLSLTGGAAEEPSIAGDLKTPAARLARKARLDRLGDDKLDAPLTDQVDSFDLLDDDVALIMTRGLEAGFGARQLLKDLVDPAAREPQVICETLMRASASSSDDRTVVVITGPYEQDANPLTGDLTKAIALLEARVNILAESEAIRAASPPVVEPAGISKRDLETEVKIEALKTMLTAKAAKDDLSRFDEKLQTLSAALEDRAAKNDLARIDDKLQTLSAGLKVTATKDDLARFDDELQTLSAGLKVTATKDELARFDAKLQTLITVIQGKAGKEDLLELTEKFTPLIASMEGKAANAPPPAVETREASGNRRFSVGSVLILVLLVAAGSAFLGAWLQSRMFQRALVSNQIAPLPPAPTPEPTAVPNQSNLAPNQPSGSAAEVSVKTGDSLRNIADRYNVSLETIKEMNPSIKNWNLIKIGEKINVPAQPQPLAPASPVPTPISTPAEAASVPPLTTSPEGTIEVTVGPGDSLNRFAQRFKSTPQRLKELNPQVSNWAGIRTGQKLLMPSPPG